MAQLVHQDAVVAGDAGRRRQFHVGQQADAGEYQIGFDQIAVAGADQGQSGPAFDGRYSGIAVDGDTGLGVDTVEKGRDLHSATRASTRGAASSTVTRRPCLAATAATSRPM